MCVSKFQHITGRKTSCNRSRPVFFLVFRFFDKPCNWQPKKFRICATATGGLVFCSWVQFDFGLFSSPLNWTCERESETPPYPSPHNNLHRFFIGTTYIHLKNKIMYFKNKGYFKISHKYAPFLLKMMRRDGINTTKQLPNGVFVCISFTISTVRDKTVEMFGDVGMFLE